MPTPTTGRRAGPDACPGALRLHAAADGPLARIRVPGGLLAAGQLAAIHAVATAHGDGHVELTSRGNLQLRALTRITPTELAGRLRDAGLLPSDTHETVRNILASPLSGRHPRGGLDVRPLVPALDRRLCAEPRLADLPGRFLFALDDGTRDVADRADVAAIPAGDAIAILLAGVDVGLRVTTDDTVDALIAAATAFLDERAAQSMDGRPASASNERAASGPGERAAAGGGGPAALGAGGRVGQGVVAWRLGELVDGARRVGERVAAVVAQVAPVAAVPAATERREPLGELAQPDGLVAVGALVPLGRLGGVSLKVLDLAATVIVTPWRGVIVPDLSPGAARACVDALGEAGLATAPGSRWVGVTACAGRPGCAKALADVRRDAEAATRPATRGDDLPVHWIGCARGCGSPAGAHVRVEATPNGYAIQAPSFAADATARDLAALVTAARSRHAGGERNVGG